MKDTQIETKNKWRATVAQVPKVEHRTSMSQLLWLFLFMLFHFNNEMTHNSLMYCKKKKAPEHSYFTTSYSLTIAMLL